MTKLDKIWPLRLLIAFFRHPIWSYSLPRILKLVREDWDKKGCPWCRETVKLQAHTYVGTNGEAAFVMTCDHCGASSPICDSHDELVRTWVAQKFSPVSKPL